MILNRGQGKNFNAGVYEWIYLYLSGGRLRSMELRHHKIYFAVRTYSHFRVNKEVLIRIIILANITIYCYKKTTQNQISGGLFIKV